MIICPSRSEALDIIQIYGVNKTNIQFAPFGLNLETFTFLPRSLIALESDLLYVATIKNQKNQLECLAILERLLAHGVKARVHLVGTIGDADYYKTFLDEVISRKLQDQVIYHGVLTQREIVQIGLTCTFSISPTRWETFGIAIVESLAMGLPVVAYEDVQCLWENFQPGLACIGVPRCPEEIARQIAAFHKNPDDYKWRSDQARKQVAHFDEKKVFRDIFKIIKKFTDKRAK
jgi:glycosyltransferase involved in cell wall biosynthesis